MTDWALANLHRPITVADLVRQAVQSTRTRDEVEPIESVRQLRDAMVRSGNECVLIEYEHAGHGFHYPSGGRHFDDVIDATALFLLDRIATERPAGPFDHREP
ncbi:hypothetical protein [Micromonospora sp. NPDC000442]|uniref:hypothetical protein n=1 Tax=Micromonospora sp. NPDC000442 TaxID=3364217 RepID=UPI0036BBBF6C